MRRPVLNPSVTIHKFMSIKTYEKKEEEYFIVENGKQIVFGLLNFKSPIKLSPKLSPLSQKEGRWDWAPSAQINPLGEL